MTTCIFFIVEVTTSMLKEKWKSQGGDREIYLLRKANKSAKWSLLPLLLASFPKESSFRIFSFTKFKSEALIVNQTAIMIIKSLYGIPKNTTLCHCTTSTKALTASILQALWPRPYSFRSASCIPKFFHRVPIKQ